jgi:hypothetical protein
MTRSFTKDRKKLGFIAIEEEDTPDRPETLSGTAWYLDMSGLNFTLTDAMINYVNKGKAAIGDTRPATIDEYVKSNF